MVDSGRLDPDVGEKVSALEPGVYCYHRSWGPGVIKEWDLFGDRMLIDFESKPGHAMKLQFAANSLDVLDPEHFYARFVADPDEVRKLATEQPVEFAKIVLESFEKSLLLDAWEEIVKGRIIPEGKYRSWWEASKKVIRADRRFVLPPKRNVPFELRDEGLSASDALLGDFASAKDAKAKVKVLETLRKDVEVFDDPVAQLKPVVDKASSAVAAGLKRNPAAAVELLLGRDELVSAVDGLEVDEGAPQAATLLQELREKLPDIVKGMGVARQRQLYGEAKSAFGDEWANVLVECLEGSGARAIAEISKYLSEQGQGDVLAEHLTNGLKQRSLGAEVLAWICKERNGLAQDAFGEPGLTSAIIGALERDHLDESTPRSNRLHDLLMDDKTLVADLLSGSDTSEVRHFTRRIQATPVFEGLNKNSLLARIVKAFPAVEDLITGESKAGGAEAADEPGVGQQGLLVSWESLRERQERFEELVNKKIPENSKEIAVAREYGDLRENFEFKAAKQQQAVLMRQKAEWEAELATARGTDFSEATNDIVSAGNIVDFEDLGSGQSETVTILGAWDTDTEKAILSYLSGMGAALLGKKLGDEVELPSEQEGVTRTVRITGIRRYADNVSA